MSLLQRAARLAMRHGPTVYRQVKAAQARREAGSASPSGPPAPAPAPAPGRAPAGGGSTYAPRADGEPDPGEVVWGWVPYEDDPSQGKDRPVLLVGEREGRWLGLYLTSKDHDRDAAEESRWGRQWMDVGTGGWDSQGRPSEVRLDRLILLERSAIRREGAAVPRSVFDAVVARARGLGTI